MIWNTYEHKNTDNIFIVFSITAEKHNINEIQI